MRLRATLLALAVTGAAALTTAAPAHAAAAFPTVVVTCDDVANRVTAGTAGGNGYFQPNLNVTVTFRYLTGSYVRDGSMGAPASLAPVTVNARTGADGSLVTSGYVRAWPGAAGYDFYTETVRAVVTNRSTGAGIVTIEGTCTVDRRTTVTLSCDTAANTVTARVSGARFVEHEAGYPPLSRVSVAYYRIRTTQATPDAPRFRGGVLGGPDFTHSVPVTDGRWSETGYTVTLPEGYYYYREDLTITVSGGPYNRIVGRASTSCEYRDAAAPRRDFS